MSYFTLLVPVFFPGKTCWIPGNSW